MTETKPLSPARKMARAPSRVKAETKVRLELRPARIGDVRGIVSLVRRAYGDGQAYLRRAPLVVQSFEVGNLKMLRPKLAGFANIQIMQLIDAPQNAPYDFQAASLSRNYADMLTRDGLAEIATYADWLAPQTRAYIPLDSKGRLAASTGLAAAARKAGLLVGTWTFRPENRFLAADFRDDSSEDARNPAGSIAEIRRYLAEGLDGFFTDDPMLGRKALQND